MKVFRKTYIKKRTSMRKGFSLVEVMMSLAILTIGIASFTVLMASSIKTSQDSRDQIIAMGLAQEGIELVRNYKDNYSDFSTQIISSDTSIDYSVSPSTSFSSFLSQVLSHTNNVPAKKLYFDEGSGMYRHNLGFLETKFSRKIRISVASVDGKNETMVTSIVSWNNSPAFPFDAGQDVSNCTIANKCLVVVSGLFDKE